ncbi:MAG: tetratricopeptide repeat protein [Leptospiraceae bacterium]|nr:tetratricopeptide repeat protein [Leptospiraceae bacterium]
MKFSLLFLLSFSILFSQDEEYYKRASLLYKQQSFKESLEVIEKAISEGYNKSDIFVLLSYNYWALEDKENAINTLFKGLKASSKFPEIYIEIIKAYVSSGNYKKALNICEKGLEKFPENKLLKLQKAILLGKLGKPITATKLIEELKVASPNDPRPLSVESHLYALRGEFDKAELSLKWALSLDPLNPYYKNNLALLYEKISENELKEKKADRAKNYLEQAVVILEEAVNINPKPIFQKNLERIKGKLAPEPKEDEK